MPKKIQIEPLEVTGLADYHCHCDYSVDATGSINEYCEAALQRNLAELCFTTHYDANPASVDSSANLISVKGEKLRATIENLAEYVKDVERAHAKYYPMGLYVRLGLEFGWYSGCEEEVSKLKRAYDFEYMLCGIHELGDICFCCSHSYEECFGRYSLEEMAAEYFAEGKKAARTGLFDTIAHLDYYKKYGEKYYGKQVHEAHRPQLRELFEALKESGTAIEINTAAARKGFSSYYPQVEIVNAARRSGVEVIHLGSDAHAPEHVGYDFDAAEAQLPQIAGGCDD